MTDNLPPEKADIGLTEGALLNRMTNRIRQSLELQEILSATVVEVRSFLGTDRVKIYRFQPDGSGQVIAESVEEDRLPSLQGLFFPATDIPPASRELFVRARQRVIVDVPAQVTTLSRVEHSLTMGDLTLEDVQRLPLADILQRPVDPCHVEYLTAMGVQSSLVIPILAQQNLWGLLVSHNATPQQFSHNKMQVVQLLADQVSIAISQSQLLSTTRERAQRESAINQISKLLHAPLPSHEILQKVLEQIVNIVEGSGGRLYLHSNNGEATAQTYTTGTQPDQLDDSSPLETSQFWQMLALQAEPAVTLPWDEVPFNSNDAWDMLPRMRHPERAIANLYQEPLLSDVHVRFCDTPIRSLLVMPLWYGQTLLGFLTIFRDEIDTDITWAGKYTPDERNQRVRDSFTAWREVKQRQSREWMAEEAEMVRSLGTHLTMAVMQNRLYECEREQRLLVEMRNQELNAARTAAEEASRLKSDFLSSTSHELRTPLASTLNYLKLLKEKFYDNEEELQQYIDVAYHSAENLVAIINDVLDIAKIEAGRMQVQWETIHLPAMLQETADLFKLSSRQKGIELLIDCQVEQMRADSLKLRQILTNLLGNAFKFTTAGAVKVRAVQRSLPVGEAIQPVVEISVIDMGIGIEHARKEALFEPFVQADGSIKRRYGGTGLGLTICKRLVELMNGQIGLDSPGKNQGTTVTFTVPQ